MSRVAILDDTEHILDLLKKGMPEHDVHTFTDPEKFIKFIDGSVDVIITDLRVSRYDAIKNIRSFKEKNIAVKVIVMSAYFNEDNLFSLCKCHIYDLFKKTHELDFFEDIIKSVNA